MTYEMCAGGGSDCEELKFDYGEYMHNLRWLYKLGKITKSEFKELVVDEPNQTMFDLVKDDYEMARQSNKL